jgi:formamidopyrimidine-DNA glycosylase
VPELPDIELYCACLRERIADHTLESLSIRGPSLLRSYDPPIDDATGRVVCAVSRLGKRVVIELSGENFLIFHLMIAGRFLWKPPGAKLPGKIGLAVFHFAPGALILTEAGTRKRAALHLVSGRDAMRRHDPGGVEVLQDGFDAFRAALLRDNRTLKRALTDPRAFSGIGNAYSDEILHAAGLSPVRRTRQLGDDEVRRLFDATRDTLRAWTQRLREQFAGRFPGPGDVTAFRKDFAVHGRYGQPCRVCRSPVQRIRYAENETNYCAKCQTGGKVLADRSLSRLLKDDWPRKIEDIDFL